MPVLDTVQSLTVSSGRKYRAIRRLLRSGFTILTGFSPFVPKHLVIAPQDLRTSDASFAEEYYGGRYSLSGKLIETQGKSPFIIKNVPSDWMHALHAFGWLRNLSATGGTLSGNHAKSIIRDWMDNEGRCQKEIVWDIETTSKRLIAWLQHSVLILSVPDHAFHQDFMRALGTHVRFLKRLAATAPEGFPKLLAYLALAYASICFSGHASSLKFAKARLDEELERQVLPDGSHVSRNPQTILDILCYLLPYRQGCLAVDVAPSNTIISATERLLLAIRFFRMGDGTLAKFNGSGVTEADLLATLLRYDEAGYNESPGPSAGGYERLETKDTVLMFDAGMPPKGELSLNAHAGCLSFELTSSFDPLIVNSGVPANPPEGMPAHWRATAAHSTAVFHETSSCKFEATGSGKNQLAGQVFSGALKVESSRTSDASQDTVKAHHHGYVREFGARHERTIKLNLQTSAIEGADWFSGPDKGDLYYTSKDTVAIHFHLHPTVEAVAVEGQSTILLRTKSGKTWQFTCPEVKPQIEESIFFANIAGPCKTHQITLRFHACKIPEITWALSPVNS